MARIMRGVWEGLFPIRRSDLEYPTEDVSMAYLIAINKVQKTIPEGGGRLLVRFLITLDSFSDKRIYGNIHDYSGFVNRFIDINNWYEAILYSPSATSDFKIDKVVSGVITTLSYNAIDISSNSRHVAYLQITGSTISAQLDNKPIISATDTTFASGGFGGFDQVSGGASNILYNLYLEAPSTQLPPALTIIEVEVTGSGSEDDPIRPNFATDIRDNPDYGKIDKLAVTFGAFDYKNDPTMLCVIKGGNPYNAKAIETQIQYAKSKNKIVEKPPKDIKSAEELHTKLKREFSEWIAGKHDFAYQTLGHADLEPIAVADFYDGAMEGFYGKDPFKNVPEWELDRTINMWRERLNHSNVSAELKEKHERKLKRILKS